MTIFNLYAQYYDLMYQDKDYNAEAEYIIQLIEKFAPGSNFILDLGCGTGRHAALLAQKGYQVHGIDLSDDMLKDAEVRKQAQSNEVKKSLFFSNGDIRKIRVGKKFDVVISLFHVLSYQITNEDLKAAFSTAKIHLKPNGLFIFDCWYGPAVLTEKPEVRIKRLTNQNFDVTRIAEPKIDINANLVEVNYHIFITEKDTQNTQIIKECHKMRYLFRPEIYELLANFGLSPVFEYSWLTDKELGSNTWSACFGCRG